METMYTLSDGKVFIVMVASYGTHMNGGTQIKNNLFLAKIKTGVQRHSLVLASSNAEACQALHFSRKEFSMRLDRQSETATI